MDRCRGGGGGGGDRYGDHPDSYRNSHSTTSSWPSEDSDRDYYDNHRSNFSGDSHHHNHHDRHHHYHRRHNHPYHHYSNGELNDSIGSGSGGGSVPDTGSDQTSPFSGRKRQFFHSSQGTSSDCTDVGSVVKLYIGAVPRTATEEDVRTVFGEYGKIVEVIFINDKRTGQQQECCFVKYSKLEEADRAIGALHDRYIFPGGMIPIKVKYADGERERLGVASVQFNKLYVGGLTKQASKRDIEEIFSPYGVIEDIYIVRDELKQNRGCAFVQFLRREMAIHAINALHGTFVMRVCELPLIVRFAEPKKPRIGEMRPPPYAANSHGQHMLPNDSLPTSSKQSTQIGSKPDLVSSNSTAFDQVLPSTEHSAPTVPVDTEMADTSDCDWSEHICPDGYKYYYNCVTCESRWEKPEEFVLYEQQLEELQLLEQPPYQQHHSSSLPAPDVDFVQVQAMTSPVVASDCV